MDRSRNDCWMQKVVPKLTNIIENSRQNLKPFHDVNREFIKKIGNYLMKWYRTVPLNYKQQLKLPRDFRSSIQWSMQIRNTYFEDFCNIYCAYSEDL